MFDWITGDELPSLIVLIAVLAFVGDQMVRGEPRWTSALQRRARQLAAAALIISSIAAICEYRAGTVTEILAVVLKALLVSALTYGVATIVLAVGAFLYRELVETLPSPPPPPAPKVEPPVPITAPPPAPRRVPQPTMEERADEARRRYEAKVAMLDRMGLDALELESAKDNAKKQYLREIDEVMK